MNFADKLVILRKEKGWSQEQLALMLGVSRQSVSKWEAGTSMPEISKLLQLSGLFLVSTDYLLKDTEENPYPNTPLPGNLEELNETQMRILDKLEKIEADRKEPEQEIKEYEYVSARKLFGLPLIHIHFQWVKSCRSSRCFRLQVPGAYADFQTRAKGIIAVGNNASGLLSIGFLAKGLLSVGLFSIGLLSFGLISFGLLALGIVALGGLAAGVTAVGYIAIGISAAGVYGFGVAAASLAELWPGKFPPLIALRRFFRP
ncbi:MAG: helix-turn-helix transcriptional regulator [Lachnospiraceae bacterium]|nr:helix-turn-helix transcriptional regulator [Lachnospiraceae bacterium]